MNTYGVVVAFHVVVAIVGVGLVGALPLAARVARLAGTDLLVLRSLHTPLHRITGTSLFVMLFSGLALDYLASGMHRERGWFQAALVVWFLVGFCHGRVHAALRRGLAGTLERARALAQMELFGWLACAGVLLLALLMKSKPF
jgi:hypothetical protein